jgi:hypothetical protein
MGIPPALAHGWGREALFYGRRFTRQVKGYLCLVGEGRGVLGGQPRPSLGFDRSLFNVYRAIFVATDLLDTL